MTLASAWSRSSSDISLSCLKEESRPPYISSRNCSVWYSSSFIRASCSSDVSSSASAMSWEIYSMNSFVSSWACSSDSPFSRISRKRSFAASRMSIASGDCEITFELLLCLFA